jgi:hypothetical protein
MLWHEGLICWVKLGLRESDHVHPVVEPEGNLPIQHKLKALCITKSAHKEVLSSHCGKSVPVFD